MKRIEAYAVAVYVNLWLRFELSPIRVTEF